MNFSHVVPLGLSCRVTYQVRAYLRARMSHPFDWWVASVEGISRYLSTLDPDRLYRADALCEQFRDGWISAIASHEFGFQLFHEFPRHKEAPPMRVDGHHAAAGEPPGLHPVQPCILRANFADPAGPPPESWRGEDARWAKAFAALGLAPAQADAALACPPSPDEDA